MLRRYALFFLVLLLAAGLVSYWFYLDRRDHSQDVPILNAARRYGVDPALVKAVVWRESRFDPQARGTKGELGLMQIMPKASAKDWSDAQRIAPLTPQNLLDPATNTLIGAWYLDKLVKRYAHTDNPVPYVLADYNAGRGNVLKWMQGSAATNNALFIQQINFPTTRDYVRSVARRYEHYRPIFPPRTGN